MKYPVTVSVENGRMTWRRLEDTFKVKPEARLVCNIIGLGDGAVSIPLSDEEWENLKEAAERFA